MIGALVKKQRACLSPNYPQSIPVFIWSHTGRRIGAVEKHGEYSRQHHATYPLLVFLWYSSTVQQAQSRKRLCGPIRGYNRMHAVLGTSAQCVATHPSDMCVAPGGIGCCHSCAGRRRRKNNRLCGLSFIARVIHPTKNTICKWANSSPI